MLRLFEGVSVKALVIVILVLSLGSFGLWKLYTGSLTENGSLQTQNVTLQQNVTHVEESAKITDSVVNTFATQAKTSQQATLTLRKETINEYIKKIEPMDVPKKPDKDSSVPDGADRIGIIASRLHENYCRARSDDPRCSAVDSSESVHGGLPADGGRVK